MFDELNGKIIVVADNMMHFNYWLKNNIRPITPGNINMSLHGIKIHAAYLESLGNFNPMERNFLELYLRQMRGGR